MKIRNANSKSVASIALAGLLISAIIALVIRISIDMDKSSVCTTDKTDTTISDSNNKFRTMIADTNEERTLGLSGRECLGEDSAMLFIFEEISQHGIWMKDMKFAIDIVWLDSDKKVIDIRTGISPDTYPEVFYPKQLSKYVIEFQAGRTTSAGIKIGDILNW